MMFKIGGKIEVNRMGFGAMQITGPGVWGDPKDPAECIRVLQRAVELGVNFIDTADVYGDGRSERLVADVIRQPVWIEAEPMLARLMLKAVALMARVARAGPARIRPAPSPTAARSSP